MLNKIKCMMDVDGVLADWVSAFLQHARNRYPDRVFREEDWTQFKPYGNGSKIPINKEEFNELFDTMDWDNISREPYFDRFKKLSHKASFVRIVTHRPNRAQESTIDWLIKNEVRFDEIYFTPSKEKWKHCSDLTHVIDDRDDALIRIAINVNKDMKAILVPRKYNIQGDVLKNINNRHFIRKLFDRRDVSLGYYLNYVRARYYTMYEEAMGEKER